MDNFQKYSRLMLLIAAGFFGFILLVALLIFILRLFSITLFHIPGFDLFFQYIILIIPYGIFLAAYYYLYKKIGCSKMKPSRVIARLLLFTGFLVCLLTLTLSTALFLHINNDWLKRFDDNSQYALIIQIVILIMCAGVLATGDPKEKDWMERGA
ncbi:MAG: hypothetical protein H7Z13_09295 [Ferruginibacter sp.]|nr:hypothetical protein [Ferruginibacter sp.]